MAHADICASGTLRVSRGPAPARGRAASAAAHRVAALAGVPGLAGAHEAAVRVVAHAVAAHAAVFLALVDVELAARARVACRGTRLSSNLVQFFSTVTIIEWKLCLCYY